MTVVELFRRCLGDASHYREFRDRIELLVEEQARGWTGGSGEWLVVPVDRTPKGFYVVSKDAEGQRRGREVLRGFLGPADADFETTPLAPDAQQVDRYLKAEGFIHLASVQRKDATSRERLLELLEDMLATVDGKESRTKPPRPSQYLDVLRDFRLALAQRDGRQAELALTNLRLTGRLSSENLRFLRVELLGSLGRWTELEELDFLVELLRARRPRAINEYLMEMIWRTQIGVSVDRGGAPDVIYAEHNLGSRYGNVLSAVDVPGTEAGRALGVVVASALRDDDRLQRLYAGAVDQEERERLRSIAGRRTSGGVGAPTGVRVLFEQGQHGAVIRTFVREPTPDAAELVIESILETEEPTHAAAVLEVVQGFIAAGLLTAGRRLRRDLDELAALVDSRCSDWVEWGARIGSRAQWPDGARILRTHHDRWTALAQLAAGQVHTLSNHLLAAWDGANQDQICAVLDILCETAAGVTSVPHTAEFCDAVQLLLAEQENLSGPVRDAYLRLFDEILSGAPAAERYRQVVGQAVEVWGRISAPTTLDWAIGLGELLLVHPSTDLGARVDAISAIVGKARVFDQRSTLRQRMEIEVLAADAGLPVRQLGPAATGADVVWSKLNGKSVGVYSLLPKAADGLERRLNKLCSPKAVEGNSDTVSTPALRTLTGRVDFMIVDTWHASHAATDAIDTVLLRDRQIRPRGRGVSGYIQALEQVLLSADG